MGGGRTDYQDHNHHSRERGRTGKTDSSPGRSNNHDVPTRDLQDPKRGEMGGVVSGLWLSIDSRPKFSTINVSLQLDTAGGTGVISSLVARMAVA